ncbi:MAG: class IV adenylate cyclase [Anaerolineae bacterium]|nr:class IV adenylate cyclase [Anaerolineae bacterium]
MATNVEIKARVESWDELQRRAEALSDGPATRLVQEDIFFWTASGRLKLRLLGDGSGQLVYYERADVPGPKPSNYVLFPTANPAPLQALLAAALGVRGVVRKQRWLYRVGQTRLHLDRVEGLGDFVELEVVLDDEREEDGARIAAALMERLGIAPQDLVEGAYVDLLEQGVGGDKVEEGNDG